MTNTSNLPMLKAAPLWAKTSVKGGQYLTGRLGGVKILVMENRDRQSDDDPSHHLFFAEPPDRRQQAPQDRADGQPALQIPQTRQPQRGGVQPYGGVADDVMPPWER